MIGLVFLGILLLIRLIFGGNDAPVEQSKDQLLSYATTSKTMELTVSGPITANQVHTQVRIIVGVSETTVEFISGYQGSVIKSETYANNSESYANFLRALEIAGYTNGTDSDELKDERGYCPTGRRHVYEIKDGNKTLQRYWSTSCAKSNGSFKGSRDVVLNLFKKQVPDYDAAKKGLRGYEF